MNMKAPHAIINCSVAGLTKKIQNCPIIGHLLKELIDDRWISLTNGQRCVSISMLWRHPVDTCTSFPIHRYRKPPEHIYPAAFNDCVRATQYFLKEGKTYGIEPTRIALMGWCCKLTLAVTSYKICTVLFCFSVPCYIIVLIRMVRFTCLYHSESFH